MAEFWEEAFTENHLMWGLEPCVSARWASDYFAALGVQNVLIPGVGYGRNARPFVDKDMAVTGIEISASAIALARAELKLQIPIHHGSVTDMPYDNHQYDGIFCYALIHLLDSGARKKFIGDCHHHLSVDGHMVFSLISKKAPMYGRGTRLGEDWYELSPDLQMYFYDEKSVMREFGTFGLIESFEVDEPTGGASLPFINVVCKKT